MAKILVIHREQVAREYLRSQIGARHSVVTAADLDHAIPAMANPRPDVIVVAHGKQKDALTLLQHMIRNAMKVPTVVLLAPRTATDQPLLMKHGARIFLEHPVDRDRLFKSIDEAIQMQHAAEAGPPPITPEELQGNLSLLEHRLNKEMKCISGKNQVYIRSKLLGLGTTRPRITLSCPLRPLYGLNREVYFEHIRDVCCGNPMRCEAFQRFEEERRRGVAGL